MAHLILQLGAAYVEPVSVPRRYASDLANVRVRAMREAGVVTAWQPAALAKLRRGIPDADRVPARCGGSA